MPFRGYLKQSTSVTIMLGPFVDEDDGKTAETGLTIAQADVRLSKNGGNMAQKTESTSCTHDEIGVYSCPLDGTDTGTLGLLTVAVHESGALPINDTYQIVVAHWYDTMCSTDYLQVDAIQIESGDATDAINAACDAAIETYKLDHLVAVADGDDPVDNSIIAHLVSKDATADWSDYDNQTESLEALHDGPLADIETDTAEIGAAGAGMSAVPWNSSWDAEVESEVDDALGGGTGTALTAIPWNANWDTEVESECNDALVANNLDHLAKTVTAAADMTTEVADNTILSRILANGDTSAFVPSTDGLQLIRDKLTDIETDTNELQTDDIPGAISGLNDLSAANVNAEVVDALATDTYSQPGQENPAATTTLAKMVAYIYKVFRNKKDQNATTWQLYADDTSTVDQKATISEAAGTATFGEVGTGP